MFNQMPITYNTQPVVGEKTTRGGKIYKYRKFEVNGQVVLAPFKSEAIQKTVGKRFKGQVNVKDITPKAKSSLVGASIEDLNSLFC